MDHLCELSPEESYRTECHYWSTHVQVHGKTAERRRQLIQLNMHLSYFPPDRPGQLVTSLPDDDVKEILYDAVPNTWKKRMVE